MKLRRCENVMTCSFSTDGDRVVSGHEDGEVGSAFLAAASPMGTFGSDSACDSLRFRVCEWLQMMRIRKGQG